VVTLEGLMDAVSFLHLYSRARIVRNNTVSYPRNALDYSSDDYGRKAPQKNIVRILAGGVILGKLYQEYLRNHESART